MRSLHELVEFGLTLCIMSIRTYPIGYAKRKAAIDKKLKSEDDLFTQPTLTSFFNFPLKN